MRDRLIALGWSEIEVIDDDLGRSAAGSVQRAGFERMVAEVCLGKVGAVAAREVSRFARNSRDWQQLVGMCRVVDTVVSVKVVEIAGGLEVAIDQAAWGGTSDGGLGVASPSINGGTSSAMASTCM